VTVAQTTRRYPLAHNSNFVLLVSGQFISQMGDRLAMVAFPWLVYTTTHSAVSTGVVLALFTLPYVLFGALAGGVLDRVDRRGVMVAADIARGGLVLAVPFVAEHTSTGVFALAFLTACATVFFDPGLMALLPDIVSQDELMRANAVLDASRNVTEILGYSLAGFVVYYVSIRGAFTVDAASFGISAVTLLAMTLHYKPDDRRDPIAPRSRHTPIWADIREGISYLRHHDALRANTKLIVAVTIGIGAFYPLTFLLAAERYHGTRAFGFMEAAIAVGYIIGSLAVGALASRIRKGIAVTLGLVVMGIRCAVPAAVHEFLPLLANFVVLGIANAIMLVSIDTFVQTIVPDNLRGRIWGVRFTLTQGAYAVGVLAAGALAATVGLGPLFVMCGLAVLVPAVVGLASPAVRDI